MWCPLDGAHYLLALLWFYCENIARHHLTGTRLKGYRQKHTGHDF